MYTKFVSLNEDTIREMAVFLNKYFNLEMGVFKDSVLAGERLYEQAKKEGLLVVINGYARLTDKGRGLVNIRAVPRPFTEAEEARAEKANSERRARESWVPTHPLYQFLRAHCNHLVGSSTLGHAVGTSEFERSRHEGLLEERNGRISLTEKGWDVYFDRDGFFKLFHDAFGGPINESLIKQHDYYKTAQVRGLVVVERTDKNVFVRLSDTGKVLMDDLFYFDRRTEHIPEH